MAGMALVAAMSLAGLDNVKAGPAVTWPAH